MVIKLLPTSTWTGKLFYPKEIHNNCNFKFILENQFHKLVCEISNSIPGRLLMAEITKRN